MTEVLSISGEVGLAAAERLQWTTGDQETLRQIVERTGAATEPAWPNVSTYWQELSDRVAQAIAELFPSLLPEISVGSGVETLVEILGAVAVGAILVLLARLLWSVRDKRLTFDRRVETSPETSESVPEHQDWSELLSRQLREGDPREALTTLWWWMCERLDPPGNRRVLTGSELVDSTARHDLRDLVERFERMMYSGCEIDRAAATELAEQLEVAIEV